MLKLHEKSRDDTAALMADIGRRRAPPPDRWPSPPPPPRMPRWSPWPTRSLRREQDILDANAIDISNGHEAGLSRVLHGPAEARPGAHPRHGRRHPRNRRTCAIRSAR